MRDERQLERFTINALNSRVVPLGSMDDSLWDETLNTIDGWFQIGGGFGLDRAGRLVQRLDAEFSVLNPHSDFYDKKSATLMQLHSMLLKSWIDTYALHQQSQLALIKAEEVLRRQISRQVYYSAIFPIEELVTVIEGWLLRNKNNTVAVQKVATLLLYATDYSEDFDNDLTPYFNLVYAKLEANSVLHDVIIQRMNHLTEKSHWDALDDLNVKEIQSVPEGQRETIQADEVTPKEQITPVPDEQQETTQAEEVAPTDYRERVINAIRDAEDTQGALVERLANKYIEEKGMDATVVDKMIEFFLRADNSAKASHWIQLQLANWEAFAGKEKGLFVQQATQLVVLEQQMTPLVEEVLGKLKVEASMIPAPLFTSIFQKLSERTSNPKIIVQILKRVSDLEGDLNLPLHKTAVQALFKYETKALDDIEAIYIDVLERVRQNAQDVKSEEFGDFLHGILSLLTYRNLFNEAEEYLRRAEKALLQPSPPNREESMISIDCYQRLICRKWYTPKTAPRVISTFRRLRGIYQSGYSNLLPNQEIFASYTRALSTAEKDASKVESALDEILELYTRTQEESCKPNAEIFQTILLAYRQDPTKIKVAGKKSLVLLDRMKALEVAPDTKCLNYIMQCVNKSSNDDVYETVCGLYSMFAQYGIEPDSFSRHSLMDACASVQPSNQDAALTTALETFGQIRQDDQLGPQTYPILTRVLMRVLTNRSERADKVATTIFQACCDDGYWQSDGGPLKKRFKSLFSRSAWRDVYTKQLDGNQNEPMLWSRKLK
ncbi:unnamed protein product [Cylindrotheca closterium]|uniref:Uncharacterized protein n=1 Tax=Cylindrotheca closterium TaxID=2856 RepID=A0AAD2G999_9STRA|nr:unnamed protein product [Cylindrotheca closterium]